VNGYVLPAVFATITAARAAYTLGVKNSSQVGVASPNKLRTLTALPAKIEEDKPMSEQASLRIVATHDFCCAYPPSPTSYGSLPGGEGLKNTVDALRAQGPIVGATTVVFRSLAHCLQHTRRCATRLILEQLHLKRLS
jgi:hypothetical protein